MSFHRFAVVLLVIPAPVCAENWPAWRGPRGDNHASSEPPLTWNDKENVRWKVALPGPGNSSPILWEDRIFVTQSFDKKGHKRGILCFKRQNGAKLWERSVDYKDDEPTHSTNPFCAGTAATDGKRVIACYGSAGVHCYDLDGKELWSYDVGKLYHIWGNSTSVILYKNTAILWCSPGERQFLLALDLDKGTKVWQTDVPGGKFGTDAKDWLGSWCTPTIAKVGDHDEMILGVPDQVRGYNPETGDMLWSCDGAGRLMYTSPVVTKGNIVVAFSGFHGPALAVRAGGKGDVTKTHRLWVQAKGNPQRIASPLLVDNRVLLIGENAVVNRFDPETGKELWDKARLGASKVWSSPVLAGERVYVGTDDGDVFVFKADAMKFEQLARNELGKGEIIRGTPAIADGAIYIRTYKHLWRIGK